MEIHRYSDIEVQSDILPTPIFHVISQNSKTTSSNYRHRYFYFSTDKPIYRYTNMDIGASLSRFGWSPKNSYIKWETITYFQVLILSGNFFQNSYVQNFLLPDHELRKLLWCKIFVHNNYRHAY
jgi:hypothetical protein